MPLFSGTKCSCEHTLQGESKKTIPSTSVDISSVHAMFDMGKIASADKMRMQMLQEYLTACVAATGGHFKHL